MLWEIFWRKKVSLSLGFCLSFSIVCLLWQGNVFSQGASFIGKISDRLSGAINSTLRFSDSLWVELDKYRELKARYTALQKQLKSYRLEQDKFDVLLSENNKFRKLLGFSDQTAYKEAAAEVLAVRLHSISPRIIINKGRAHGVKIYMPVITRAHNRSRRLIRAAVGVVVAADENTSVVQPLTHSDFRMGVRLRETGHWGILSGNSGKLTEALLTFVSSSTAPERVVSSGPVLKVRSSYEVISSGAGGVFPAGIPVGFISRDGRRSGEFKTAYIKPYAVINSLDTVSVILKEPERWSRDGKSHEKNQEEHLATPFGEPEYPEMDAPKKPKPRRSAPPQPEKKDDRKEKKPVVKTTPPVVAPTGENKKKEPRKTRRLRNLKPPGGN